MCVAYPGVVQEIRGNIAVVDYGGVKKEARIDFLEEVKPGDYVVVHVGYAISKLSKKEAEESLELFAELLKKLG